MGFAKSGWFCQGRLLIEKVQGWWQPAGTTRGNFSAQDSVDETLDLVSGTFNPSLQSVQWCLLSENHLGWGQETFGPEISSKALEREAGISKRQRWKKLDRTCIFTGNWESSYILSYLLLSILFCIGVSSCGSLFPQCPAAALRNPRDTQKWDPVEKVTHGQRSNRAVRKYLFDWEA